MCNFRYVQIPSSSTLDLIVFVFLCLAVFAPTGCYGGICSVGWTWSRHSLTCIRIFQMEATYNESVFECQSYGTHLVKVDVQDMKHFLYDAVRNTNESFWVKSDKEGKIKDMGCMQIKYVLGGSRIPKASPCDEKHGFICERTRGYCKKGWTLSLYAGTCMLFYNRMDLAWDFSKRMCSSKNAQLVTYRNDDIFPQGFLSAAGSKKVWIGLNYRPAPSDKAGWYNNRKKDWKSFDDDIGDFDSSDGCVYIRNNAKPFFSTAKMMMCSEAAFAVCEKFQDPLTVCPTNWIWSSPSGTCVAIFLRKVTWERARDSCKSERGELLMVFDDKMNHFLRELLSPYDEEFWIGLNDRRTEGDFRWIDFNDTLYDIGFIQNNSEAVDCVYVKDPFEGWPVQDCDAQKKYICEKFAPKTLLKATCDEEYACPMLCKPSCGQNCNPRTGVCFGECPIGFTGPYCNHSTGSSSHDSSKGSTDDPSSHELSWSPGFCHNNTYGENCSKKCSPNCGGQNTTCNFSTGICLYGCVRGFVGNVCSEADKSPTRTLPGVLLTAFQAKILALVMAAIIVVIIAMLYSLDISQLDEEEEIRERAKHSFGHRDSYGSDSRRFDDLSGNPLRIQLELVDEDEFDEWSSPVELPETIRSRSLSSQL